MRLYISVCAIAATVAVASASTGCAPQAVFPTLTQIEKDVAADIEAGKSDADIAADVCKDLGGNSTVDAVCAGAAQTLADVVKVLIDTKVLSVPALERAKGLSLRLNAQLHPMAAAK